MPEVKGYVVASAPTYYGNQSNPPNATPMPGYPSHAGQQAPVFPGGNPGNYPAPQPGPVYPGGNPGTYPAPQPGPVYPGGNPGTYSAPQPGPVYPGGNPGNYPAPQPGPVYPGGHSGNYPAPQPGMVGMTSTGNVIPTDTPTYAGETPAEDVDENAVVTAPPASAPPAEKLGFIEGYNNLTFDTGQVCPPPSYDEVVDDKSPENRPAPSIPVISEDEAREALAQFASEKCYYGKGVPKDMVITEIKSTSAYHYKLESFCEARSTMWAYEPYRGGFIDGPQNGPAPTPWQIDAGTMKYFQNGSIAMPVPHTQSVIPCHNCQAMGTTRCHRCMGRGMVRCVFCHGRGHRTRHHTHDGHRHTTHPICHSCGGSGRKRCSTCYGHGWTACAVCLGACQLKCYVKLTVTWTNHTDDSVSNSAEGLPSNLIQDVSGQEALNEENPKVWPVNDFPDAAVNEASNRLLAQHVAQFNTERMLRQRQTIRVIPVTQVEYEFRRKPHTFYVYGFEHKVHHPDYPQKFFCCAIL